MHWLIEPGFFASGPVRTALFLGGAVAVISGVVGVFTVIRGQSFAGHALTDVSAAGGSLALFAGLSPVIGFLALSATGAGSMEAIGTSRVRGRDLATGIVLGVADGLAALFLYFDSTKSATTGATQQILFGSIFAVEPGEVTLVIVFVLLAALLLAVTYRPLLLSSVNPELAAARGVPTRLVGLSFMLVLAIAVGLSAVAIGAILSTALLIGPPAAALRLSSRPRQAFVVSSGIGLGATWLGILLAYDSYYWSRSHDSWPVSFCVVIAVLAAYALAGVASGHLTPRRGLKGSVPRDTAQAEREARCLPPS
jgi:zinc/manganese transport system permease protein